MTFTPGGRTLPFVVYGQFRTLINLLLVLALGAIFIWGGFRVFGVFAGSASATPALATSTPIVERPTTPTPPAPTATRRASAGAGAKATPTPRPTPRPSPTPNTPPKVFAAASTSDAKGATNLSVKDLQVSEGFPIVYCRVRNSALPPQGSVTYTWYRDQPSAIFLGQYPILRYSSEFTDFFYRYTGFQTPGTKYHCDVTVNGQPIGTARFTITP